MAFIIVKMMYKKKMFHILKMLIVLLKITHVFSPVSVIPTTSNLDNTFATTFVTVFDFLLDVDSIANRKRRLHVYTASIRISCCSLLRKWSAHRQTNWSKECPVYQENNKFNFFFSNRYITKLNEPNSNKYLRLFFGSFNGYRSVCNQKETRKFRFSPNICLLSMFSHNWKFKNNSVHRRLFLNRISNQRN